jgi:hypothetical protein
VIRFLASLVVLTGVACAQSPGDSPPLVARGAANVTTVSPGTVSPVNPKDETRPLPDIPPLPAGKATLVGGTIDKVDHIRDRLVLQVFGGGRTAVLFDERTNVFRGNQAGSLDDLKNGERIYADTMLDGTDIFARNIRIVPQGPTGQSSGQVVDYQPGSRELTLRDTLSPEPVTLHLAGDVVVARGDRTVRPEELSPGTLVNLTFSPGNGEDPLVRQISILASPGAAFLFAGRVEHLDLHSGLLVLVDPRDNKNYEVYFDPSDRRFTRDLRQGANVTVQASFDGTRYQSRDITVNSAGAK